jgi:RNA polymerase sigma-70 factor (ECF subfamily)
MNEALLTGPPLADDALAAPTSEEAGAVGTDERMRALVKEHFTFVWKSLRGLGVPAGAADDAAQQVFMTASAKLAAIAPGAERSFLFGTAMRVAANARRVAGRRREVFDEAPLDPEGDASPDPEKLLEMKQARALLDAALDAMPDDSRTVFVLFVLEGLAIAEIADILCIPIGTVGSRLRRGREQFNAAVKRLEARLPAGGRGR